MSRGWLLQSTQRRHADSFRTAPLAYELTNRGYDRTSCADDAEVRGSSWVNPGHECEVSPICSPIQMPDPTARLVATSSAQASRSQLKAVAVLARSILITPLSPSVRRSSTGRSTRAGCGIVLSRNHGALAKSRKDNFTETGVLRSPCRCDVGAAHVQVDRPVLTDSDCLRIGSSLVRRPLQQLPSRVQLTAGTITGCLCHRHIRALPDLSRCSRLAKTAHYAGTRS